MNSTPFPFLKFLNYRVVWSLNKLVKNEEARKVLNNFLPLTKERNPRQTWVVDGEKPSEILYKRPHVEKDDGSSLLAKCDTAEMTGSFLHLHLALDASGLDLDSLEAHYTGKKYSFWNCVS